MTSIDYRFMPMRCTYNTVIGTWQGEWAQCDYDATSLTLDEEVSLEPAGKYANATNITEKPLLQSLTDVGSGLNPLVAGATTTLTLDTALAFTIKDGSAINIVDKASGVTYVATLNGDVIAGATSVTIDSITLPQGLAAPVLVVPPQTSVISASSATDFVNVASDVTYNVNENEAGKVFILADTVEFTIARSGLIRKGQGITVTADAGATAKVYTSDTWENITGNIELTEGQSVRLTLRTTGWAVEGNFTPI
jgi:hypothetical protein